MFSKTHGLVLLTLSLLLLGVSCVCAVDNVSGNISEPTVFESNVFTVSYLPNIWAKLYDTRIEVDPYYLSGSDGDIINFTTRVYYSGCVVRNSFMPLYVSGQCFGGSVSLHEDGKLIDSVILSKDNNGTASFSFKFKTGHRYHLEYHGYSSPDHDFGARFYVDSPKDLNINIV